MHPAAQGQVLESQRSKVLVSGAPRRALPAWTPTPDPSDPGASTTRASWSGSPNTRSPQAVVGTPRANPNILWFGWRARIRT